jgi:ATP-dependent DNA ligase
MKKFPTLYKRDNKSNLQEWTICVKGNGFYVIEGIVGGKLTTTNPHFCEAKSQGKKNATTAEEQTLKEAQAKWDYKQEHGYCLDPKKVDSTKYLEPMLAKQYDDYKDDITWPVYCDDKLNGVRMNALSTGIKSRKGTAFNTIPHIEKAIASLFKKYPNLYLDGEGFNPKLKNHLNRLIEVVSVAYKPSDVTPELLKESEAIVQFWVYDGYGFEGITPTTPFIERRAALKKLLKGIEYVYVLDYKVCQNDAEVQKLLKLADKNKDEGVIVRWGNAPYEHKRSKYLLKLKNFMDSEFKIVKIEQGHGNWHGYAKRITLELPKPIIGRDGKEQTTFASNIEGNQAYLKKIWNNPEAVLNKMATVRYLGLSEYGVPQIPYVVVIRGYE